MEATPAADAELTEEQMKQKQAEEEANKGAHQEQKDKMLKQQMKVFGAGARRRSLGVKGKKGGKLKEKKVRRESATTAVSLAEDIFDPGKISETSKAGTLLVRIGPNPNMKKWRMRYVILSGTSLLSFVNEAADKQTKEETIAGATLIHPGHKSQKYSFSIRLKSAANGKPGTLLEYASKDAEVMGEWTEAIKMAIDMAEIEAGMDSLKESNPLSKDEA